jgi:predicted transcriptional regulator
MKKILGVLMVVLMGLSVSVLAGEDGENNKKRNQGRHLGQRGKRGKMMEALFADLPEFKAEIERHKNEMKEIHEKRKAVMEGVKDRIQENKEDMDKDTVKKEIEGEMIKINMLMIEERARHQETMASLLRANKQALAEKMNEQFKKHRGNRDRQGKGGKERGEWKGHGHQEQPGGEED